MCESTSVQNGLFDPSTERIDKINESLSVIQLKKGLMFGTDSYLLAAFAHTQKNGLCVELGGGTGVVSLLVSAREKYRAVYSAEIQEYFSRLIERNARLNSLEDKLFSINADIRELSIGDIGGEAVSVISNPPYMKINSGKNNASPEMNAARREENGTIFDFAKTASRLLKHGGYFTVVYRPDRFSELIYVLCENRLEPKRIIFVYPSPLDKPCLVLVESKKGASPGNIVSRPLIIYKNKETSEYTDDMKKVYSLFSVEFLFD